MAKITKSINFGEINHLLYVRIMALCADLGYATKDFIFEGCCLFFDIVDDKGVSHFEIIGDAYRRFYEDIQKRQTIPRMNQKHAFVVKDIQDEVCEYLTCVKNENNMRWVQLLGILLMLVEIDRDKTDEPALAEWAERENKIFILNEFSNIKMAFKEGPYKIDKTRRLRDYEKKAGIYPERLKFDFHKE